MFIKNFAQITQPPNMLLKGNPKFVWVVSASIAFDDLKQDLTAAPVLPLPKFQLDLKLMHQALA